MEVEEHDVIVAGVGGVGSATVYYLAKRGLDVLGVEQHGIPHDLGSSHGITRTLTLTKAEGEETIPIARRALELWKDLQHSSREKLFEECGHIKAWPASGKGTHGSIETAINGLEAHNLQHEMLTGAETNERFPGFNLPPGHKVIYQPDSGLLEPELCISTYVREANNLGATIHGHEQVHNWKQTSQGVRIQTDKNTYEADKLIITAGAWASKFYPELKEFLTPERRIMAWFQPDRQEHYTTEQLPAFSIDVDEGYYYGTPQYRTPGIKIGNRPNVREQIDPDSMERSVSAPEEELLRKFTDGYLPSGTGPTLRLAPCLVTFSSDDKYIIGPLPNTPNVIIAAGFSANGFHVAPALGELLTDIATDEEPYIDPAPFSLSRFNIGN